jgi:rare lipoprotein A
MSNLILVGLASYYSVAGCLGCSENMIMANGDRLDDTKLTVAYNHAPLNSYIGIINLDNLEYVIAKVTDRGGFEKVRIPKIVDLSVATKDAIHCEATCRVQIVLPEGE